MRAVQVPGPNAPFEIVEREVPEPPAGAVRWYSGTAIDSEAALAFSVLTGVRSMNESFPLERAAEAYDRMISGKARFRVVLVTGQ